MLDLDGQQQEALYGLNLYRQNMPSVSERIFCLCDQRVMKILYVSQCYPPETAPAGTRASELGRYWVAKGHEVTVLTGFPNYPTGKVHPEYQSKFWRLCMMEDNNGVLVSRTWLIPLPNCKSWHRMLSFGSFTISAAIRGIFLRKPDIVIGTSPQLLVGLSGLAIAKRHGVPFVFEVRDLWPESLEAVGISSHRSLLVRSLKGIAGLLYRKAAHIVVVTAPFKEHLERVWSVPSEKISVIVNGVDHHFLSPQSQTEEIAREFDMEGRFVVGYFGNIGNAHGIETLIEAADLLKATDTDIVFLVIGEGAEKEKLRRLVVEKRLSNIRVFPGQPRSRIAGLIAAAHVCLVLLKNSELFKTVIPTKMLEFMSCGRPVIAAVSGEAARLLVEADAGVCVPPENAMAIAMAIRSLRSDAAWRTELGSNARKFIVEKLPREGTAREYLSLLQRLQRTNDNDEQIRQREAPEEIANAGGGTR